MAALVGPSGSGKTTLLQIASLLDSQTAGASPYAGKMREASERVRTDAQTIWVCLPVPPLAARVQRARKCGDAAPGRWYERS